MTGNEGTWRERAVLPYSHSDTLIWEQYVYRYCHNQEVARIYEVGKEGGLVPSKISSMKYVFSDKTCKGCLPARRITCHYPLH